MWLVTFLVLNSHMWLVALELVKFWAILLFSLSLFHSHTHTHSNLIFPLLTKAHHSPWEWDNSLYLDSYVVLSITNVLNLLNHFPTDRCLGFFFFSPFQIYKNLCAFVYFQHLCLWTWNCCVKGCDCIWTLMTIEQ